jgi:hypothetical protein
MHGDSTFHGRFDRVHTNLYFFHKRGVGLNFCFQIRRFHLALLSVASGSKTVYHRLMKRDKTPSDAAAAELRPDGWDRFVRAVHAAAESGPKHKITPQAKERPASKGRVHKGKTGR